MGVAKARVLVVDDDPFTLETYRAILRLTGYDAEGAATGRDALARMDERRDLFQLLLVDLRLPDMSGLEVLASVSDSSPDVPVVMMSGSASDACTRAARQLGAADFLEKPFVAAVLVDAVARTLARVAPREAAPPVPSAGYAAARWASLIVPVARFNADVPTLDEWSRLVGRSRTTVKTWCQAAAVQAGDSLDFARALRIVLQQQSRACNWFEHLAIVDPRTLKRFLDHGGLLGHRVVPGVAAFLDRQRFITDSRLIAAVRALLTDRSR